MRKKQCVALLLALALAASLLTGCAKNHETQPKPEPEQTGQEVVPSEKEEKTDVTEQPEKKDEQQPQTKPGEEEQQPERQEPELTPEQKRRKTIEAWVAGSTIWARDEAYANPFTEQSMQVFLTNFLFENWENEQTPVRAYFEADDFRMNLYQNTFDEYFCVLSHTDTLEELIIRMDANGAAVAAIATEEEKTSVSQEIAALVDGAVFDKRYDGYYFDDKMDAAQNKAFRANAAQALSSFQRTLEENRTTWKPVLDDAFRVTVSFDENDQFVFELQGKTAYWLELRYRPECGVWSDVSLIPNEEADWELDAAKLTDGYLLSLVTAPEICMTSAPFTFAQAKDLTQQQLWLLYLLLTPRTELEATYQETDGMYHIASAQMDQTLSKYLKGYDLDITKDINYDETTNEIVVWTVSGFGGGMLSKLREKQVEGNTVTFTVDYYAGDDTQFTAPQFAKTYTITFRYGGYFYDCAAQTAAAE